MRTGPAKEAFRIGSKFRTFVAQNDPLSSAFHRENRSINDFCCFVPNFILLSLEESYNKR